MRPRDLTGVRFSHLTALHRSGSVRGKAIWACRCDCGKSVDARASNLLSGNTKSCGCIVKDVACGWVKSPEYTAFRNAKNRCEREKDVRYHLYGGRGIEFRFADMAQFIASVGPRPTPGHSLDRIDPNGHYEPGNVRWATNDVQAKNKQDSLIIEIDGVSKPLKDWCAEKNQPYQRTWERIKAGWHPVRALAEPAGPTSRRRATKIGALA